MIPQNKVKQLAEQLRARNIHIQNRIDELQRDIESAQELINQQQGIIDQKLKEIEELQRNENENTEKI